MPFSPPDLDTFKVNTRNLYQDLTTRFGRYQVDVSTEPVGENGRKPTALTVLIARVNVLNKIETKREGERKVFSTLINQDLRSISLKAEEAKALQQIDKEQCQQAEMILLGALFYRYFRLIKTYEQWDLSLPFLGRVYDSSKNTPNCKLFLGIRDVLQLPKDLTEFKTRDLQILDRVTIVTALECFQEHMQALSKEKFAEFVHLNSNDDGANFKRQLQEIILEHKVKAKPQLHLFHTCMFLTSLEKKVSEEHEKIKLGLVPWFKLLNAEHKDFSRLSAELIEEHIKAHVKDETLKNCFIKLLYTRHVSDKLYDPDKLVSEVLKPEELLMRMKECDMSKSSYTLMGGYILILEITERLIYSLADKYSVPKYNKAQRALPIYHLMSNVLKDKQITQDDAAYLTGIGYLRSSLYQALGLHNESELLTSEDKLIGVTLLKAFIDTEPELNTLCFGSMAKLQTEVTQLKDKLEIKIPDKESEVESAPALSI